MVQKKVNLITLDGECNGQIFIENGKISLLSEIAEVSKYGDYQFTILKEIRAVLEKNNIFLLLNGSRKDVYPSGLSLMGNMAYIQTMGKQTELTDLVNIFDETSKELIGTIEEQINYHKEWLKSIGW